MGFLEHLDCWTREFLKNQTCEVVHGRLGKGIPGERVKGVEYKYKIRDVDGRGRREKEWSPLRPTTVHSLPIAEIMSGWPDRVFSPPALRFISASNSTERVDVDKVPSWRRVRSRMVAGWTDGYLNDGYVAVKDRWVTLAVLGSIHSPLHEYS